MPTTDNNPVANPTWYSDIRWLFTQTDIDHMRPHGVDLASYDEVKASAPNIYSHVAMGSMPMPPASPWPAGCVQTFLNWMTNGYPKGTNPAPAHAARAMATALRAAGNATRVRKDINDLSAAELANLVAAFKGILAKDPADPNSYFVQAGYHWLPAPTYCQHHVPGYNPWHRAYLVGFENALRSVPGCENVTLPYWDITTPFPDVLKAPPFDKYVLPEDIGGGFNKGYTTTRYAYPDIRQNLLDYGVADDIGRALTKTDWEDFHGMFAGAANNTIIAAHDGGHVAIGETMGDQAVAAFDPVFWFFHANWDRLFWEWQKAMQATTLNGLLSTINKNADPLSYQIFTVPPLENLTPFTSGPPHLNTVAIIDSENSLDVDYQPPSRAPAMNFLAKTHRMVAASQTFSVRTEQANVRVQGLNRLKIPGSFKVHLLKDGARIASRAFFQPNEADKCETCVNNAVVHFDFELPLEQVSGGRLSVVVEPLDKSLVGDRFPHKLMGSPTIEVRLLMNTE